MFRLIGLNSKGSQFIKAKANELGLIGLLSLSERRVFYMYVHVPPLYFLLQLRENLLWTTYPLLIFSRRGFPPGGMYKLGWEKVHLRFVWRIRGNDHNTISVVLSDGKNTFEEVSFPSPLSCGKGHLFIFSFGLRDDGHY